MGAEADDGTTGGRPTAAPTIYDVAREAGVSPSTVSRALSRPGRVSFETAERIRHVAAELGYHTKAITRTMPEQTTKLLALVVADIANPVYLGMIRGAERTAKELDYTMLLVETQENERFESALLDRMIPVVDGIILGASRLADVDIRRLAKQIPLVVLNRQVGQVTSVSSDNLRAVKRAVEHLGELGHTTVTYLAGPENSWSDGVRWRGLREAGLELDLRVRRVGPYIPSIKGGAQAAQEWMEHRTSAVLAYNDLMAIGFMRQLALNGVDVPRDVSVIGFDNISEASLIRPRLTTMAAPQVTLGATAVNHLLRQRRQPVEQGDPVLLPVRLMVRESTGPAAPDGSTGSAVRR
ncbi:transcriptional regulator, LacI family [Raineyella antarctica]|uniref:Transcriptional regulator, LacI family n=1 Tax=Raineyella antarctica TaxID=1577474 RepID=A0A1G6GVG9_9ACTN|nr:LacI family DNA-binding transcriptional regulator [Raineyella antarctica]SDB86040.1 transcriptional regulator, LacI family [Raineyella antarctica]